MHCHDDQKKSLLQFLRKKHENFNIAVKKYNPTLDEAQLEGRVDRLSENNYNGLVLRMHGYDDKKKGPLQF